MKSFLRTMPESWFKGKACRTRRLAGTRLLPRMDRLESRALLTTLTVSNTDDSGPGSLRDALSRAVTGDVVVFDRDMSGGTIRLTSGSLEVDTGVAIRGPGAGRLTVSGDGRFGVFAVDAAAGAVTISGVTIADGAAESGAGVRSMASMLTLDGVTFRGNTAGSSGAVEQVGGTLIARNDVFIANRADGDLAHGGAIALVSQADADVASSRFIDNVAAGTTEGRGGAIDAGAGSDLRVENGWFAGNQATGLLALGGAIDAAPNTAAPESGTGMLTVERSQFLGNSAAGTNGLGGLALGGAIASQGFSLSVGGSSFTGNHAAGGDSSTPTRRGDATGGAIYAAAQGANVSADVHASRFAANSAAGGAALGGAASGGAGNAGAMALYIDGSVAETSFVGNTAHGGSAEGAGAAGFAVAGALDTNGTMAVSSSLFLGNQSLGGMSDAGAGGQANAGAINDSGHLTLSRTRVLFNAAHGGSGAQGGDAIGGGIATTNASSPYFAAVDSLIAGNSAAGGAGATQSGHGFGGGIAAFHGTIALTRTQVILNHASTAGDNVYPPSAIS